jgi:hypothetical protein
MMAKVFGPSSLFLADKLQVAATSGAAVDMEPCFSQLTLDIIGKAVFNYDFNSLTTNSPLIQAVYTSLKETEQRATDLLPYWKVGGRGGRGAGWWSWGRRQGGGGALLRGGLAPPWRRGARGPPAAAQRGRRAGAARR